MHISLTGNSDNKDVYIKLRDEEKYDGFYAVITNLEDDISGILKINRQRWEIEENFCIMKTDFEARPVYARREDRTKTKEVKK